MTGLLSPCLFCRSCERSLRSLDQESPPKKKKLQPTYTSTTHLLAGKKCPSSLQTKSNDIETTVFYIPGVDVKVSVLLSNSPPSPHSHSVSFDHLITDRIMPPKHLIQTCRLREHHGKN